MDIIKKFEPLFGEWYAESFIGAGSFGRVYKIYREEFGEKFYSALKYISIPYDPGEVTQLRADGMDHDSISTYYQGIAKDITSEITLMNKLRGNTNIVSFEDSRIVPKESGIGYDIFIRMELLKSLTTAMIESPLTPDETARLGQDLCSALVRCKNEGIIHRDIKPDNIFISSSGDYKLGDFGIARKLEKTATFMSKKGTYNYMAPEVYRGEKYGAACDIYSLGLVMYRMLNNNRLPFLPAAPNPITAADREMALSKRFMGEAFPPPCNADHELTRIVLKACAFRPEDRYPSAKDMYNDILRYRLHKSGVLSASKQENASENRTQAVFSPARPGYYQGDPASAEAHKYPADRNGHDRRQNSDMTEALNRNERKQEYVPKSGSENAEPQKTKKKTGLIAVIAVLSAALLIALVFAVKDCVTANDKTSQLAPITTQGYGETPTPTPDAASPITPSPTPVTPSPTPVTPGPTPVTPSPTPAGDVLENTYCITNGTYYIKSPVDGKYLGLGLRKNEIHGGYGYYLSMVTDKRDAIRFEVIELYDGVSMLSVADFGEEPYYLEAFNSEKNPTGADVWKEGREIDQYWVIIKKSDGTYRVYLESDNSKMLSYYTLGDNIVSVRGKGTIPEELQEWNFVKAG